jgi:hypothetical protein
VMPRRPTRSHSPSRETIASRVLRIQGPVRSSASSIRRASGGCRVALSKIA